MRNVKNIKPQDILLLLKLVVNTSLSQQDLANELGISQTEISLGLRRLKYSGLLTSDGSPNRPACKEFLVHGLKYVYPAELGTLEAGLPTSHSKPGFKFVVQKKGEQYVWPHPQGKLKGIALKPIYPSFPDACMKDEDLYKIASLVEMIRAGRAREKNLAATELLKAIGS